jgi:hypothetical protein
MQLPTTARGPDDVEKSTPGLTTQELIQTLSTALDSTVDTAAPALRQDSTPIFPASVEGCDLKMSLWITSSQKWVAKFKRESPTNRSIMLLELLEAFSDGEEGVNVSFSEPE